MATKHKKSSSAKICLLGATFDTGNMGVSALAASVAKCIIETHPFASIVLLNYGERNGSYKLQLANKTIDMSLLNMSFSKRIWESNHYIWQFLLALLCRLLPWRKLRQGIAGSSKYLKAIMESEICFDISGGDSFSDIYGLYRLFYISSCKLLVLLLRKKLFLLPQTYGPFRKQISRQLAKYILRRADAIYSRDRLSAELVGNLLNERNARSKVQLLPDVAFVMDSLRPNVFEFANLEDFLDAKRKGVTVVGLNISGLLLNGGYIRNNMFGLKVDYRKIVYKIIDLFMGHENVSVLLVPHVFVPIDNLESDVAACTQIYEDVVQKYPDRVFCVEGTYNHSEIKYVIGLCDFFIGSRMHACIAALSQYIPAVGLAYSRKFYGVFETLGLGKYAIDMCESKENDILDVVSKSFQERQAISQRLRNIIPGIRKQILEAIGNCIEK